ncbi:MAG: sigma-54 dependent transcriptional regulator [Proteobacteria bacterium]|nr:sigma-54 dependent transcriptional regulator [Pseudomonadota bacterium]MBU1641408.1 sigma-54 dependent transcriptional regulator [Pseudomonadota bacterium]
MQVKGRIFVVEDDELIGSMLARALRQAGYEVRYESTTADIFDKISSWAPDITLLDNNLPGISGLEILDEINKQHISTQVVMLTADDSVETSVKAMKLGATDYLVKPFNMDEVLLVLAGILEKERLRQEVGYFRKRYQSLNLAEIIGADAQTLALKEEIKVIAQAGVDTVLITGESGTGKELVADYIHQLLSDGSQAPMIRVNCAALPESLLEAELFGHAKGTFTDARQDKKGLFELADGGCLLLDEIGEMKLDLQSKLLRALEERSIRRVGGQEEIPVSVTVLATTNKDIAAEVEKGRFRLDLFYRLNTFHIKVLSLRNRPDDISPLARHFLDYYNKRYRKDAIKGFSKESLELMRSYSWPGNVRELRNMVERLVVLKDPVAIEPHHLPPEIRGSSSAPFVASGATGPFVLPPEGVDVEELEKNLLIQAMEQSGNSQKKAAALLHMKYDTFRYKLKKHGLST